MCLSKADQGHKDVDRLRNPVKQVKDRRAKVFIWTVNDARDAVEMSEIADGIITDNVEAVLEALRKYS